MSSATDSEFSGLIAKLPTPDGIANPYPIYRELRPHTPLPGYRDYPPGTVPGQDEPVSAWVLMKYNEVAAAARDHETFSSRDPLQEASSAPSLMLVNHDPPEHERLRNLVNVAFSRKEISSLLPWVSACIMEMLDELPRQNCEVVGELTSMIPARVMMRLFGQPDEDAAQCRRWATAFMLSADLTPEQREQSNKEMFEYFARRVQELAQAFENGEQLPEGLIAALIAAEVEGERLSIEEVIRFCVTLIVAGAETTTFLLANLIYNLATMPELAARLRADTSLVAAFIEESLRHSGPPQRLFRIATCDVVVGGREIREGDWVALFFGAANHDPDMFPNPESFDLDRPNHNRHLSMGLGIHHCLGFAVAKLEARAVVDAILERFPDMTLSTTAAVRQTSSLLTYSFERLYVDLERGITK